MGVERRKVGKGPWLTEEVSSGGGGLPIGWTQDGTTGAVVAESTTAAGLPLKVQAITPGQQIADFAELLRVDTRDGAGALATILSAYSPGAFEFTLRDVAGNAYVIIASGTASPAPLYVDRDQFRLGHSAAPADGSLAASTFALWLDATPGATKLMVKAKDSGGTVRTGSLALT